MPKPIQIPNTFAMRAPVDLVIDGLFHQGHRIVLWWRDPDFAKMVRKSVRAMLATFPAKYRPWAFGVIFKSVRSHLDR
jgi:hypothetical protein